MRRSIVTLASEPAVGIALRRGHRSLPMKWRSHSSAARFGVERAHGRVSARTSALPDCDLCRRTGRGPVRLRVRARGLLDLALHPDAVANGDADHRLRSDRPGIFGVEASARAGLAPALALDRKSTRLN